MKGGIYSIDGKEACELSMDVTLSTDECHEPPTKKVLSIHRILLADSDSSARFSSNVCDVATLVSMNNQAFVILFLLLIESLHISRLRNFLFGLLKGWR